MIGSMIPRWRAGPYQGSGRKHTPETWHQGEEPALTRYITPLIRHRARPHATVSGRGFAAPCPVGQVKRAPECLFKTSAAPPAGPPTSKAHPEILRIACHFSATPTLPPLPPSAQQPTHDAGGQAGRLPWIWMEDRPWPPRGAAPPRPQAGVADAEGVESGEGVGHAASPHVF